MQLTHNHPLRTVNYKSALRRHQGQFTHEDLLFLGPACLIPQPESDVQRCAEGQALADAVEPAELGVADFKSRIFQDGLSVVAFDGENLIKDGLQSKIFALGRRDLRLQELDVGVDLDFDQVGRRERLFDLTEVDSFCLSSGHGYLSG